MGADGGFWGDETREITPVDDRPASPPVVVLPADETQDLTALGLRASTPPPDDSWQDETRELTSLAPALGEEIARVDRAAAAGGVARRVGRSGAVPAETDVSRHGDRSAVPAERTARDRGIPAGRAAEHPEPVDPDLTQTGELPPAQRGRTGRSRRNDANGRTRTGAHDLVPDPTRGTGLDGGGDGRGAVDPYGAGLDGGSHGRAADDPYGSAPDRGSDRYGVLDGRADGRGADDRYGAGLDGGAHGRGAPDGRRHGRGADDPHGAGLDGDPHGRDSRRAAARGREEAHRPARHGTAAAREPAAVGAAGSTDAGAPAIPRPLYARALFLRNINPGPIMCFLFFEGSFALGAAFALAGLVHWWALLVLPATVAVMVKLNDVVAGSPERRATAVRRDPEREPPQRHAAVPSDPVKDAHLEWRRGLRTELRSAGLPTDPFEDDYSYGRRTRQRHDR